MLFHDRLESKLSRKRRKKIFENKQHIDRKSKGRKKRKTSIVRLENDMLCSSSVISHGVEWTAGLLAWLTFWHPPRQRSLSGTSRETAGLYELVTSFVLFLLHGRWNPHQIRQRCRKRKNVNWSELWILEGKGKWKKKFCSHLQMKCSCVSFLASARSKIGKMEYVCVCVWRWKSSDSFVTICFDLKRGWGETALFTVCGSMSNLYLIYDISHKSSDQRHDPGVFLQIAFSVPQQLWNYSSSRKPLSWTRWSPRMAVAILIWNSSEKVISWS